MEDYILDTDYDLLFEKGDFKVGNSERQTVALLLGTGKGHWKHSPNTGIAFEQFINSSEKNTAKTQIQYGIQDDRGTIQKIIFLGEKLEIEAEWTTQ